jgi:hypothetical protein
MVPPLDYPTLWSHQPPVGTESDSISEETGNVARVELEARPHGRRETSYCGGRLVVD